VKDDNSTADTAELLRIIAWKYPPYFWYPKTAGGVLIKSGEEQARLGGSFESRMNRACIILGELAHQMHVKTCPKVSFCHPVAGVDGIVPPTRSEFGRSLVAKFYPNLKF